MTGDEKFDYYTGQWATPSLPSYATPSFATPSFASPSFASPDAARKYRARARRLLDVLALKEPDRVPVYLIAEGQILDHAGFTRKDAFYDVDRYIEAGLKMHRQYDLEYCVLHYANCGRALDTLGMTMIRWPGSQVPGGALPDNISFQNVEREYMQACDYDDLIVNPEGFILRRYLPRVCPELAGLAEIPNAFNFVSASNYTWILSALARGKPARKAFNLLLEAADQAAGTAVPFQNAILKIVSSYGAPVFFGGATYAPFDIIGDAMRCTVGIMTDLYRYPDRVAAAAQALVPMAVRMGTEMAMAARNPFIVIPLHKGGDIFMPPEQFSRFYWPSLKAVMNGLIDQGCVPVVFAQGAYDRRLDIIAADPMKKGRSVWIFDRTDMAAAKEKIGPWACIGGNVPASLFKQGTPSQLEAYCRDLMDTCAPGGGFFLAPGDALDQANPENIQVFVNYARTFGRY